MVVAWGDVVYLRAFAVAVWVVGFGLAFALVALFDGGDSFRPVFGEPVSAGAVVPGHYLLLFET